MDSLLIDACSWTFDGWTEKLAESQVTALNFTLAGAKPDFLQALLNIERTIHTINGDPDHLILARTTADIRRAQAEGKVAIVFNMQNGRPVDDSLLHLELLRELGLRAMQLTYNERNFIGDGRLEPSNAGLSNFGRQVVKAMNRLRLVIDLAHVGERTALEAMELSERPCLITHGNPRKRANNPRNLTDDEITACAQTGGVIGVCGWGPVCWTGGDAPPSMDDYVGHIEYIVDLVGVDHVGMASDSTTSMRTEHILEHAKEVNEAYPSVTGEFVEKFGNSLDVRYPVSVTHLHQVRDRLLERGWKPAEVEKVAGGNFLRVWKDVWGE